MAAAAYASLVSLLNTMDQIKIHHLLSTCFDNHQNGSLRKKVDFLIDFLENYSDAAEELVRRIAVVAHEAEDVIEVHAAHRVRVASTQQSPYFLPDLQLIMQDMDSIKVTVIKAKEEPGFITRQLTASSSSATPATSKTTPMVGFDSYVKKLSDQLTGHHSGREIFPIVGMGGIGKTTLARYVYESSIMVRTFNIRAWVTVSQEFNAREILLQTLSCLGVSTSSMDTTDDPQLGLMLHQTLFGRRYLVVLDDIWSVEAWEKIMFYFPENNKGSRIVVTTRESKLVNYFGSSPLVVDFLDDKNSWDLFCVNVFAQEGCPSELEEVGKKIVDKCKGLPLTIVVIGGLLGKSPRTFEFWEKIAKDKSLILDSGEGNRTLSILNLSYKHLPIWLKSCFLYFGLFPEDYGIDVSQLIELWVAEGFIKSNTNQSLEEVAQTYLKDLLDRNLLLVRDLELNKKLHTCRVHDLVRDLCIRIAEKEDFFCVQRDIDGRRHFISDKRTAMFYPPTSKAPSLVRPQIVEDGQRAAPFKSRLLRVLFSDGSDDSSGELDNSFREVNLRFLFHPSRRMVNYELPSSISLLWNLQTLIVMGSIRAIAPSEIWKMPQLRQIKITSIRLPDPRTSDGDIVLQNLQTLRKVKNLIWSEEVCKRIPNIKKLGIEYNFHEQREASPCYQLHNLGCLNKLERLYCYCSGREYVGGSLKNLKLPNSLKELILLMSRLVWSDMAMIASLPRLEILTLHSKAMVGAEWDCVEEEFLCLKHLQINSCGDLMNWRNADSSNFPVLETLSLKNLSKLDEIPPGIGEIPTLEKMFLFNCSGSAIVSAVEILEEQEHRGNLGLQLRLKFKTETEEEMFRGNIEEFGFTCQNLLIIPPVEYTRIKFLFVLMKIVGREQGNSLEKKQGKIL